VAAALLGLLAVVALTSSRERPGDSGGTDPGAVAELRDVVLTVGATLCAVALVAAIWLFWKFRGGGRGTGPDITFGSYVFLLFVASVIYWGIHHHQKPNQSAPNEILLGPGLPQLQPPPPQQAPGTRSLPPAEFEWELAGGLLMAIGLVAVGIVIWHRRRRPDEVELDPLERRDRVAAELASIVDGTIDDLRRERDPRRAVIAAYAQMEKALSNHGLPRERSEAPFEYLARMLRELRVRAASALALTELFERARFSHHVIDASMKDEAIDALIAVRDDLKAAPA
jgi:hypothetical protein